MLKMMSHSGPTAFGLSKVFGDLRACGKRGADGSVIYNKVINEYRKDNYVIYKIEVKFL
jgi:hypothetical protein